MNAGSNLSDNTTEEVMPIPAELAVERLNATRLLLERICYGINATTPDPVTFTLGADGNEVDAFRFAVDVLDWIEANIATQLLILGRDTNDNSIHVGLVVGLCDECAAQQSVADHRA